ncbi:MAG: RDD family protein [Rubrivivax sp.]
MAPREVVGPLPRLLAFAIDALWLLLVSLPLCWGWRAAGLAGAGGWLLGLPLLLSLGAVPCWLAFGGTPGQLLLQQEVVDADRLRRLSLPQALARWAAGWASALSGGFASLWTDHGRQPQAWHDRRSGALVVEADVAGGGFLARHRAGELPLAQSLVVVGLWLPLPLLLLLGWVDAAGHLGNFALRAGSVGLLLGWPLLVALLGFGLVGVWRAARRPQRRRAAAVVGAWAAPALMAALLLGGVAWAVVQFGPQLADRLRLPFGRDPLGTTAVALSADGRRLQIKGPLALGSADAVRRVLAGAPQLRLVTLDAQDGRLPEALQIAEALRARRLPTRVVGACSGVCVLVFLAGPQRQVLPGASLALHRLSAGPFNPPYQTLLNRALGRLLAQAGLDAHLVNKVLASPPARPWTPDADERAAARLVTVPGRPLDVELPAPQGATVADYAEALSASALWQALERRFPGVQALAAQRMGAAGPQGAESVQIAAQEVVAALMPGLLAQASPETRWLFAELLQAQIGALLALDPGLCRALLLGDVAAHRRLPPPLAWREAQWLLAALEEPARATPARKPNALELEVIRRTLGLRAPQRLAELWRPPVAPAPPEPSCERGQAMLAELATLAAPQRRLALRLIFERE